jgi:hypothetical protein
MPTRRGQSPQERHKKVKIISAEKPFARAKSRDIRELPASVLAYCQQVSTGDPIVGNAGKNPQKK